MKIGILGGGQLARMMILDGARLNFSFRVFDKAAHSSTEGLAEIHVGDFLDESALKKFADGLDVVTCEFENIPAQTLAILEKHVPIYPCARALEIAQDRLLEKQMFSRLGVGTPEFVAVSSRDELTQAAEKLGYPFVLKQRSLGYDGKGQAVVKSDGELDKVWTQLGSAPLIAEQFVKFDRELSIIAAFSRSGEIQSYPLVQNEHRNAILHKTTAPAKNIEKLESKALEIVKKIGGDINYVGVLTVELFQVGDELLANEIAPRVHNSGHWTIEGALTSQFENHLRAVAGLPLGSTELVAEVEMENIISTLPELSTLFSSERDCVHLYNKEPRPGRKLGHITRYKS